MLSTFSSPCFGVNTVYNYGHRGSAPLSPNLKPFKGPRNVHSQPGGIDSFESISGLLKRSQVWALLIVGSWERGGGLGWESDSVCLTVLLSDSLRLDC